MRRSSGNASSGSLNGRGYEVVGVPADADDLVRKARAHHPDLLISDIEMPPERPLANAARTRGADQGHYRR
jgi:AmiR/NasT family two-component response regulator